MSGSLEVGHRLLNRPASTTSLAGQRGAVSRWDELRHLLPPSLVLAMAPLPPPPSRMVEHVGGRTALALVMNEIGCAGDPMDVQFPHPRLSVSHSGRMAVAIGASSPAANGVGVDLEYRRGIDSGAARFFLDDDEQATAQRLVDERALNLPAILLQLWTVKEAVFKADLENNGQMLRNYGIETFGCPVINDNGTSELWSGTALRAQAVFVFWCIRFTDLTLTFAQWKGTPT